jgi:hypothetical protein
MPKQLISDATVRSLPTLEKQTDYWDLKFPAFGVRVSPGGTKTFVLNQNKTRRTIGRYPDISLSEARTEARRLVAEKTLGRIRPRSITYPQAVTVFLDEKRERRKERTVKDHKRHLDLLGFKCQLADVTHQDMERKLKRLPPSEFNHRLACAKTFFTWAQKKRYITDNPTVGLTPHKRSKRKRTLTDDELRAGPGCLNRLSASISGALPGLGCQAERQRVEVGLIRRAAVKAHMGMFRSREIQ